MALGNLDRYTRRGGLALDWPSVKRDADSAYQRLGLTSPPLYLPVRSLSGGNAQRFVLARELGFEPKLIIALYPTRGLDVPSTNAAERLLVAARAGGAGVLLISEDLGQLFALSDRLIVLYRGRIVAECRPQETSFTEIGYAMTGANPAPLAEVTHGR
jgi:simple sugar transport system ATP-binding protein